VSIVVLRTWLETDHWREIIDTMQSNRLRTALTAAGVFWGVFMLITMLGMGHGLENGVTRSMSGFATNSIYVWGRRTSKPYKGFQPGRYVRFENGDADAIRTSISEVEYVCPRLDVGGWRGDGEMVSRGERSGTFTISGDVPTFIHVQPVDVIKGRFMNELDQRDRRKVAVIGTGVETQLFAEEEEAVGRSITVKGSHFQVVGVFEPRATGDRGEELANSLFVPLATFQAAFNQSNRVGWFALTAKPWASGSEVESKVKNLLALRHDVAPDDPDGIGSFNAEEEFDKFQALFSGIEFLIWFVGTMTLIAGVIGVSNIMLIAVKERTKEIGVRRAVGASPSSVIGMIVQESVALTSIAGYAGVVAGVVVLEIVSTVIGDGGRFFAAPGVDLSIALVATAVLVAFGALAGVMPARAALRIKPVEALRME
jgi:putative ABC transport system permease protein